MEQPLAYLIMLNWNGKKHLEYSIPSVLRTDYPNYRLLVVDNGSRDESVSFVRENYPEVEIIVNDRNLAWAGGNNVGIRYALRRGAQWVVLINNDVLVDPRWIRDGIKAAQSDPRIGFVGFHVVGESVRTARKEFYAAQEQYNGVTIDDADTIIGCALMVRADVFRQIGFLDEVYFIYEEENDFEFRARTAGYRMIRTNVPLWHYSEGWGRSMPLRSAYLATRNSLRRGIKTKWTDGPRYTGFQLGHGCTLRWTAEMLYLACSPFVKMDRSDAVQRRIRPSNPLVNFWIVLTALLWNLVHLPQTMRIHRTEQERMSKARERFAPAGMTESESKTKPEPLAQYP